MSRRDPVAGPGPSAPAMTGIPVSATVGVIVGTGAVAGNVALGELVGKTGNWGDGEIAGIGAGELLRVAGSSGGDWVF